VTDAKAAVDFLERLRPGGPWLLSACDPNKDQGDPGAITTTTVRDSAAALTFVRRHNGTKNLYFSVNPTRHALEKKAAKVDIAAIEYALADCDPKSDETSVKAKARYLAELEAFRPRPSAIIDSGNGVQCLWRLEQSITLNTPIWDEREKKFVYPKETQARIADVESRIKAAMLRLGAKPGTQNIDRILRLPGTMNLPNRKKRDEGREPCPALLLEFNDTSHPLAAFPPDEGASESVDWNGLPERLQNKMSFRADIMRRWGGDKTGLNDTTRSGMDMSLGALLKTRGFTYEDMCTILRAFRHGKGPENSERDLQRIWDRSGTASSEAVNDFIARLNRDHAVVLMGGQVLIMCEQHDQPQFMSPENFHLWLANDKVEIEVNKVLKKVPVSRVWIAHPERRQYSSVVFDPLDTNPEHYNLWHGFSVQPDANKSCEKFLAHIRDNICSGNREHFLWVMGFLAHMVQKPQEKPGVSLVLRGPEGVGKGFFANWIGKLCLHHFVVISQASHLTGRFNAHFLRALLAFVDEAFWAGDKSGEGALKHLVTDEYVTIEGKHKDPITVRNLSRLIIASNEKWVVPAGTQARRWGVLDVAPTYANNRAYFNAIDEELRSGGLAGLMHHLQTFDLGAVDVHTPPKTAALMEQKEESFAPHVQWWAEALKRGALRYESEESASDRLDFNRREKVTETDGWPTDILKETLWLAYKLYLREHNIRSRVMPDSQLHKWFGDNNLLPGARDWRPRGGARKRHLRLPSLEICRAAFSAHVGQAQEWDADDYGEEAA
jgi:Family of unknown function (DUF5906)